MQVIVPVPDEVSITAFSLPPGGTTPDVPPPDELDQLPVVEISQVPVPPTQNTLVRVSTNETETAAQATEALNVAVLVEVAPAAACNSSTTSNPSRLLVAALLPLVVVLAGAVNEEAVPLLAE